MDDLISRAAALKVIDAVKSIVWSQSGKVLCGKMYSQIKDLPSVDAAPVVHGRWVYEYGDPVMMPCSVCGYQVYRYNNTPYCPHCGAKMDTNEGD